MVKHILVVLFGVGCVLGGTTSMGVPLEISNDFVVLRCEPEDGSFTVGHPGKSGSFVSGKFSAGGGHGAVVSVSDKTFGSGKSIQLVRPDGSRSRLTVHSKIPFALIGATLKNDGLEPVVLNKVPLVSFLVDLGRPAMELKVLGTGGLSAPNQKMGSYAWLAVAEPASRNGVVAAWLTHNRASGVLMPGEENGRVKVEARGEYGRLLIKAGMSAETEVLAVGFFDDARIGLEAWADAVAQVDKIKLRPQPAGYCTWYSEKHGGAGDENSLAVLTEFAAKNLKPYGFGFVQIDDLWQAGQSGGNGPHKNFTTHRSDGPYPGGMKKSADMIRKHGMTPGLWFMPFAGTVSDPWFKDHQDWFVKDGQGKPFTASWTGTCLDMTHQGAREYLRDIVLRISKDWGYTYFKMDGIHAGTGTKQTYPQSKYTEDNLETAVFSNPEKTSIEAYRDGLRLVREAAGPDVFFLACCAPQNMRSYEGAFGLVDAMRIGPDNGGSWGGWANESPVHGSRHYFLQGRIWYNDPDPVYLRKSIPLHEIKTMCSWTAISGQLNANSDWLPDLSAERLNVFTRSIPAHGACARPADLFDVPVPSVWTVSDSRSGPRRDVVALFNWEGGERSFEYPVEKLGLTAKTEYAAFDFWANTLIPAFTDNLKYKVGPHGCAILSVKPVVNRPQLLSTSRHVTQGIVDVLEEKWGRRSGCLSGVSKVVGGDEYEMRFLVHSTAGAWKFKACDVSKKDEKAGVTVLVKEESGLVRVMIQSRESRDVAWSVSFDKP